MKKVWIEITNYDKEFITNAIENGVDGFFTSNKDFIKNINNLAQIDVYDINNLPNNIIFDQIESKLDEIRISNISSDQRIIIDILNWTIIPIENILSIRNNIYLSVSTIEKAIESIEILEKGVDGIYIKNCSNEDKINILKKIKSLKNKLSLSEGKIISIKKIISGDRVCIDTISNMTNGEGMLIGDFSRGMVLVNAECQVNQYVSPRPFRVNAGAVHSYIKISDNKTKYLSDLNSGDDVLIVNSFGEIKHSVIGRVKQEKRPLLHIEIMGSQSKFSVILQNAETVCLVAPHGKPKSVLSLQIDDKIVIYEEKGGRHFGNKINETINER